LIYNVKYSGDIRKFKIHKWYWWCTITLLQQCSLTEAQVNEESLSYQTARLSQKNSRLRALLSHSRAQYCSQLAAARHMLHSRNAKVSQLRTALVKVRDLCHSIDSSYRVSGSTYELHTLFGVLTGMLMQAKLYQITSVQFRHNIAHLRGRQT
jgi:hypothetical protein